MTDTKRCLGCGEVKPLDAFHRSPLGKQGRRTKCIECWKPYYQEYFKRPERAGKNAESSRRFYKSRSPEEKADLMARIAARRKVDPTSHIGKGLRRALERRPTENHVTVNELLAMWKAQDGRCAVSGVLMTWANGKHSPTSISIDRIDPALGYTKENSRLVCYQVNLFKSEWTDVDMLTMAIAIIANAKPKLRLVS